MMKCVTLDDVHDIKIDDLEEYYGEVPETFTSCFLCGEPSTFLRCAKVDPPKYADRDLPEPAAQALADELRGRFGTDIELPVCDLHRKVGLPQ